MKAKFCKQLFSVICIALSVCALAGCGSTEKEESAEQRTELQKDSAEETESELQQGNAQELESELQQEAQFSFGDISKLDFYFSSGAGGWATELNVHADGTFKGQYYDSDMGDTGDGYPGGVMYLCDFNGKFTQPKKVNDYTYAMQIETIELANTPGTEEIKEGICYRYSEPYGLDSAEDIFIYLPGSPLQELPEAYRSWVGYYDLTAVSDTELPFYGLYNVKAECGFSSYASADEGDAIADIDAELAAVNAEAEILENKLQSGILTQIELNQTSAELYKLWDDELNSIWSRLKEKLDVSAMEELTKEEKAWIANKESEVSAAGAEYGEGTMRPLVENDLAAELTKDRVYALAELLR